MFRIKRTQLREMVQSPEGAAIHVTDTEGQVFSVNEGSAFKSPDDPPYFMSPEYFAQLKQINESYPRNR